MEQIVHSPESEYVENVLAGLAAAECLGFNTQATLQVCGFDGCVAISADALKPMLIDLEGDRRQEVAARLQLLFAIKSRLNDFDPDDPSHRRWIESRQPYFDGKSAKMLLITGDVENMKRVIEQLRKMA